MRKGAHPCAPSSVGDQRDRQVNQDEAPEAEDRAGGEADADQHGVDHEGICDPRADPEDLAVGAIQPEACPGRGHRGPLAVERAQANVPGSSAPWLAGAIAAANITRLKAAEKTAAAS